jgi:hypothetical protein
MFSLYTHIIFGITEAITAAAAKFKNLNDFPLDLSIITLDGVYSIRIRNNNENKKF